MLKFSTLSMLTVTSKSAIGRAVQTRLDNGLRWTWKGLSHAKQDKFIPENIDYCQDFLNFLSKVDPYKTKCFDEAGFRSPDCGRPNYGHSPVNTPCIDVGRYLNSPNVTFNLLGTLRWRTGGDDDGVPEANYQVCS